MLASEFIIIAIILRFLAGATYLRATWQGRAHPSLVSWFSWGVTALIAFIVQMHKGAGAEAWVTLAIGLSPLVVFTVALVKRSGRVQFTRTDKYCIALTFLGVGLWLTTGNPLLALLFGIFADIASSVPTVLKSYRAPHTEHAGAYSLSMLSMVITLLTIQNWGMTHWLFPAYIFGINAVFVCNILVLSKLRSLRLRGQAAESNI